jgi:hypothetical protein
VHSPLQSGEITQAVQRQNHLKVIERIIYLLFCRLQLFDARLLAGRPRHGNPPEMAFWSFNSALGFGKAAAGCWAGW